MSGAALTAARVLRQLRHDPRTIGLLIAVPAVLMTIFRFVYEHDHTAFEQAGPALMVLFPLITMFLVTSVALLRERTTGTLERLLTTPLSSNCRCWPATPWRSRCWRSSRPVSSPR